GIQGDRVGVQHEQHDRQHESDEHGGGVAHDLQALLAAECEQPANPAVTPHFLRRSVHAALRSPAGSSAISIRRMKASSIVGSGSCADATLAFSASGESSAMTLARYIRATRSQYSASSMKCVVTITVAPFCTRPLMW